MLEGPKFYFTGEVAARLNARPKDITMLFYCRKLDVKRCPTVGGRRLIPVDYVEEVKNALIAYGLLPPEITDESEQNGER